MTIFLTTLPGTLVLRVLHAVLSLLFTAGLVAAAVLAPAPPAVLPLLILLAIGIPLATAWELPATLAALRDRVREGRALVRLRRTLDALPETHHPLGL
jgi:hypothetical protein